MSNFHNFEILPENKKNARRRLAHVNFFPFWPFFSEIIQLVLIWPEQVHFQLPVSKLAKERERIRTLPGDERIARVAELLNSLLDEMKAFRFFRNFFASDAA
jgi:hypothetical protein